MKMFHTSVASILLAFLPFSLLAEPVVQTAACQDNPALTCATGIDRLEILGRTFDVDFVVGSYEDVFADNDPYFINDFVGFTAAVAAMENALDTSGVVGAIGTGSSPWSAIYTPENDQDPGVMGVTAVATEYSGPTTLWISIGTTEFRLDFDLADWQPGSFVSWAVFSLAVDIDVKPGSYPNSINPKSKGKIPVAIFTTDTFIASQVDWATVLFGPAEATESHGRAHVEDVDGDGDIDLLLHFNTQETGIACDDTEATLTGETFGGEPIFGTDSIVTVNCF